MPLPSVGNFVRDQGRNPFDFVGNALNAFVKTSAEFRATRAQNLDEQQAAQQGGDQRANSIQQDRLFGERLTDIGLDRQEQAFRMLLAADDQEMQRDRFGMDMEIAGLRVDALKFERDELRPLEVESARLGLGRERMALGEQRRTFATEQAVRGQFESDFSLLRDVQTGNAPLPSEFITVSPRGVVGNAGLAAGTALSSEYPRGSIITNQAGNSFLVTGPRQSGKPGVEVPGLADEGLGIQEFAISDQLLPSEIPSDPAAIQSVVSGARPQANFESMKNADRFRATAAYLQELEQNYGGRDKAIDIRLRNARTLLENNPTFRSLKATGGLETRPEKLQRRQQINDALSLALPHQTDAERRDFLGKNPGLVDTLMRVPPNSLGTAIRAISTRAAERDTSRPDLSAGFYADLRDAQKDVLQQRGELRAAESNPAFQLQVPQIRARLEASETFLKQLEQQAGGGTPTLPTSSSELPPPAASLFPASGDANDIKAGIDKALGFGGE